MEQPKSKYKCQRCKYEFWREKPGSVTCEVCGHDYIDWTNSEEVLTYLYNHDPELSIRKGSKRKKG